ncbi:MAG: ABC transporter ATP-binding protein [Acidipropionibacterium sp.]|jgi:ABC-2 type transport system ATP-binding protein|nr:ABC transporter ATP-binding protein [Acidipropionibacterium sp.]
MTATAIQIEGLVKTFGKVRALDGLDLAVPTGSVRGFLGPNGAGKSTTIRVLLGLIRADSGAVRLLDGDPWSQAPELHRRLAYVPGDVNLWPNLTGGEAIDLLGRARGGIDSARRDDLIERFSLDPRRRARAYSKGNRQKVALIAALASDAELLLLDEPTSGLDPLMERTFTDLIREEAGQGRTVLLSSHILSEVEKLCDSVSIIRSGRIVETGTLAQLRHLHRLDVVAELADEPTGLEQLPGLHDLVVEGTTVRAHVDADSLDGLLAALSRYGVRSLTSTPPSLEELFLSHYSEPDAEVAR